MQHILLNRYWLQNCNPCMIIAYVTTFVILQINIESTLTELGISSSKHDVKLHHTPSDFLGMTLNCIHIFVVTGSLLY